MKFSILIPVYNTAEYIYDCFQSILKQSYDEYEVVFVDDGPIDDSSKICDEIAISYPQIVKVIHQKNQGQLVSRCNAIKIASGDYCIFVDSDDIILEFALEKLKNVIEENSFPDMVLYPFIYEDGEKRRPSKQFWNNDMYFEGDSIKDVRELFFTTSIMDSMCTKAIKRDVLLRSLYNTDKYVNLRCSEDRLQAMWIMDNVKTAVYLNDPLYVYRLFDGSTTRSFSYNAIERNKTTPLYDIEREYLLKWGFTSEEWIQRFDAGWISYMVYVFLLFYRKSSQAEKKRILSYPWGSFVPKNIDDSSFTNNKFLNSVKRDLYLNILKKNKIAIDWYVRKVNIYKWIKQIKKKD